MRNKCQENVTKLFKELNDRELEILFLAINETKGEDFKSLNLALKKLPSAVSNYENPAEYSAPFKSLQNKIATFKKNYKIEGINRGNAIILGVSDIKAPHDACVFKLWTQAEKLTPETQQRLYNSDTIAKPLLLKSAESKVLSLPFHLAVMPKYSSNLLTFLGAQLQEEVATTQTQAKVAPIDNARILTCLPRFQTMAQKFLTLQKEGIFFPDAKNANWLVNGDSLIIADTKSLSTFDEKDGMDLTPKIMAPESRKLETRKGNPPLTPDEVEKAHVYLLACNIIEGITQMRVTGETPEQLRQDRVGFIEKIGNPDLQQCLTQCIDDDPSKRPTLEATRQILKKIELDTLATKEKTIAQALSNEPTNTLLSLQLKEVKLQIELVNDPKNQNTQKDLEQTQLKIQLPIKESKIIQAIHRNPEDRLLKLQLEEVKLQRKLAYYPENEYNKKELEIIQLQIAKNRKEQELKQALNNPIARLELEKINLELKIRTSSLDDEPGKYYTDIDYRQRLIELYKNESTKGMAQVLDATVRRLEATPDSIFNPAGGANKAQAIKKAVSDFNTTDDPIDWRSVEEALDIQRGFFKSTTSAEHFRRAKETYIAATKEPRSAASSAEKSAEEVATPRRGP